MPVSRADIVRRAPVFCKWENTQFHPQLPLFARRYVEEKEDGGHGPWSDWNADLPIGSSVLFANREIGVPKMAVTRAPRS